jgi:hypothetical protein
MKFLPAEKCSKFQDAVSIKDKDLMQPKDLSSFLTIIFQSPLSIRRKSQLE